MQITIAKRLVLMLICGLAVTVVVGLVGVIQMGRINEQLELVQSRYSVAVEAGSSFALAFADTRRASVLYTNTSSDKVREMAKTQLNDAIPLMRQRFSELKAHMVGLDEEKRLVDQEGELVDRYLSMTAKLIADLSAPGADHHALTENAVKTLSPLGAELLETLGKHRKLHYDLMQQSEEASVRLYRSARMTIIIAALIGLAALAALGIHVIHDVRSRLNRLCEYINAVNRSLDFSRVQPVTRFDEVGQAVDAFNKLVGRLRENFKTLALSADSVKASATEMATASQQVAAAADQQSDAASNMAATLEQVSVSINHVADKASETDAVVRDVNRTSESGEKAINAVMQDIQGIAETVTRASGQIEGVDRHSAEIASVVLVIKDVADQTNLLALNAAIEAARAGESGRGFAVVADEVRKLAERTAHSTAEIEKTVSTLRESAHTAVENMQTVTTQVATGVDRAREANAEIGRISQSCQAAVAMVTDIAQSIREQGAAANSIAAQVERIAQMSDESSAAAHTNAETAGKLDHVAADMKQIIGAYRLDAKLLA